MVLFHSTRGPRTNHTVVQTFMCIEYDDRGDTLLTVKLVCARSDDNVQTEQIIENTFDVHRVTHVHSRTYVSKPNNGAFRFCYYHRYYIRGVISLVHALSLLFRLTRKRSIIIIIHHGHARFVITGTRASRPDTTDTSGSRSLCPARLRRAGTQVAADFRPGGDETSIIKARR